MSQNTPITVAYGDGIGPEIMDATLRILTAAGARLDVETIEIGEKVWLRGIDTGLAPGAYDSLRRTRIFLKAPVTTPQGGGYSSLNVTTRKTFGLYANVRPCVAYNPFVATKHPGMDVVIVRENEEDLYAGIEHRQTQDVYQCLKLVSRPGTEKIVRYAFEYARRHNRKKVTCFSKDNIMKMTDGLFHRVFDEIGAQYPDIEKEHLIVDIGAARLADTPEDFDVIVMPNLYGDILSDVAAQIAGSVGLAGSANVGPTFAMFEAIHGSAPSIAGQNIANPSGLLLAAVMMLVHIGQASVAKEVHNAWLKTIEDGVHTFDIYNPALSKEKVGTREFADAVIARLGQKPEKLKAVHYNEAPPQDATASVSARVPQKKELIGVDVFVEWNGTADALVEKVRQASPQLELRLITNRGLTVWPAGSAEPVCSDQWCCRYIFKTGVGKPEAIPALLDQISNAGVDFVKVENLYTFDGKQGFTGATK